VHELLTVPTTGGASPIKPIIMSITSSTSADLQEMVALIQELRSNLHDFHMNRERPAVGVVDPSTLVAIELNTSCPNIKGAPPPAYNFSSLVPYLDVLASAYFADPTLTIGLKLPPYIYSTQFQEVALHLATYSRPKPESAGDDTINPFAFISSTNTLGTCLLFKDDANSGMSRPGGSPFALPTALGGLGGEALHPLALGNVHSFSRIFAESGDPALRRTVIIGVGGITSVKARQRMVQAGASVVACATLLGEKGVEAFRLLTDGLTLS
jgi:dihydroorotate dehydrogenase (fumarate)